MRSLGLKARGGIGKLALAIQAKAIQITFTRIRHVASEVAVAFSLQARKNFFVAVQNNVNALPFGSPDPEVRAL
jgi:hypothetical protein